MHSFERREPLFRLWIATYVDWRPKRWSDVPPCATAVELVENKAYSFDEAALFLEGFNTAILENEQAVWAVAVPIIVRYEGDTQAGAAVSGFAFAPDHPATAVS